MFLQLRTASRVITIIFITAFTVSFILWADDSFARRDRKRVVVVSPRVARPGYVSPRLPEGHRRVWHGRDAYFYHGGVFYRPGPSGFIVVRPPVGTVVVNIPVGFRRVWVGNAGFYVYGNVFYRKVPGGYTVVEAPADVVVEEEAPVIVQPSEAAIGKVSVTVPVLNVRSGPTLMHPSIYQIQEGYILEIHGKADGWLYVQLPNGEFGWVMSEFTTLMEPPANG